MKRESPKAQETGALVSLLFRRGEPPSDFALGNLETMLQLLEKSDSSAFRSFRGASFALRGDKAASIHWHEEAIATEPDISRHYIRYAESLCYLKDYDTAISMYEKAAALIGDEDPEAALPVLNTLLFTAYLAGKAEKLRQWLHIYESLAGEVHGVAALLREGCSREQFGSSVPFFAAACASGAFKDWEHPDEDEAWKHL